MNKLDFLWWNVQDFSHFDVAFAGKDRWPLSRTAFQEKLDRVVHVIGSVGSGETPPLMAFAETTEGAAEELKGRLPGQYDVFSLNSLTNTPNLELAIVYRLGVGLGNYDYISVENAPSQSRAILTIEYDGGSFLVRFYFVHWVIASSPTKGLQDSLVAKTLRENIYDFLYEKDDLRKRHVVVMGDFNLEPYGFLEEHLHTSRHRRPSLKKRHPTDVTQKRVYLYNCSWRLLGERHPHPASPGVREFAGTYYYRKETRWVTFDQIIVSGTLLGDTSPRFDEQGLTIVDSMASFPDAYVHDDGLPQKFFWDLASPRGLSDHLPIVGSILLKD